MAVTTEMKKSEVPGAETSRAALAGNSTPGKKQARRGQRETNLPLARIEALMQDTGRLMPPLCASRPSRDDHADEKSWRDAVRDWWLRWQEALKAVWPVVRRMHGVLLDHDIAHPGSTVWLRFEDLSNRLPDYASGVELDEEMALRFLVGARALLSEAQAAVEPVQATAPVQVAPRFTRQRQPSTLASVSIMSPGSATMAEKGFLTVQEIAFRWGKSDDYVRSIFAKEPGVLVGRRAGRGKRAYTTLLIPREVLERVERRMSIPCTDFRASILCHIIKEEVFVTQNPAKRKRGRPPRLVDCPFCKRKFKTRDLRAHLPRCSKRPE